MNDRLDELLTRLPGEPPAPDLAERISLAVVQRRRAQRRWRQVGLVAVALGFAGVALMASAWSGAVGIPAMMPSIPDGSTLTQATDAFLAAPLETLAELANGAFMWETTLIESIEGAFLLGVILLTIGAFGELARLLRRPAPLNGYSY